MADTVVVAKESTRSVLAPLRSSLSSSLSNRESSFENRESSFEYVVRMAASPAAAAMAVLPMAATLAPSESASCTAPCECVEATPSEENPRGSCGARETRGEEERCLCCGQQNTLTLIDDTSRLGFRLPRWNPCGFWTAR